MENTALYEILSDHRDRCQRDAAPKLIAIKHGNKVLIVVGRLR